MKYNHSEEISLEPKKFNLSKSKTLNIDPETIPTLVKPEYMEEITKGDESPYFKVQEIDITEEANGVMYKPEFWESYLSKLSVSPIPGSKTGHTMDWGVRPNTDLYLVGGNIAKDKKSVFLKNYIPPTGESGDNTAFIRNAKANMIHFSIVAYTRDVVFRNEDGYITAIHAIESIKGERNDAVELNMGAMKQKTNNDKTGGPDKSNKEDPMENSEMIAKLKVCIENGSIKKSDIAKDFGFEIVTDEHQNAVAIVSGLRKACGSDDVVKVFTDMTKENSELKKANFDALKEKKLTEAFGPIEILGKCNLKRSAAELLIDKTISDEAALTVAIEEAKKNSIVLSFAADEADITSKQNIAGKEIYSKDQKRSESVEL